jgi:hypothetical protein
MLRNNSLDQISPSKSNASKPREFSLLAIEEVESPKLRFRSSERKAYDQDSDSARGELKLLKTLKQ